MRPMSKGVCETMTEQQEPEHCGHEKVCILFRTGSIVACNDGTPCMRNSGGCKTCECDTRQHNKIPPAYEAMLAESLTEEQTRTLLMWLARNKKEMFSRIVCPACKEDVAEKAAAEARKDEREKVLKLISNTDRGACPYDTCIRSADMRCRDCLIQWIEVESLRSEVKTL